MKRRKIKVKILVHVHPPDHPLVLPAHHDPDAVPALVPDPGPDPDHPIRREASEATHGHGQGNG